MTPPSSVSSSRPRASAHTGYGVAESDLDLMFGAIRDTVRDLNGAGWTQAAAAAWDIRLAEIATIACVSGIGPRAHPLGCR
jgi:hypothetical protein